MFISAKRNDPSLKIWLPNLAETFLPWLARISRLVTIQQ